MKNSDPDRGEMTDEQLDHLLAAANSELLEHIEATDDPGHVLAAIMNQGTQEANPSSKAASPPLQADPGQILAAAMISLRIRARVLDSALADVRDRDLARALTRVGLADVRAVALAVARTLAVARDLDSALVVDLARVRAVARTLTVAGDLDSALTVAGDLDSALTVAGDLDSALARAGDLVRDLARVRVRVRDLARVRVRARADALARTLVLVGDLARALTDRLDALQVDASGADLSDLEIRQLDLLAGVIWTRETAWPAGVAVQVEAHSEEIRPGVYQVRRGGPRDRDPLIRL